MNFIKSFVTGNVLGNLPYDFDPKSDSISLDHWLLFDGKSKNEKKSKVTVWQSQTDYKILCRNTWTRFKTLRHPNLVEYKDGIETSNGTIYIITESIQPLEHMLQSSLSNASLNDQGWKWGLQSILSALEFLNSECQLIHGMIHPKSIFITLGGQWKLAGYELCTGRIIYLRLKLFSKCTIIEFKSNTHLVSNDRLNSLYKSPGK